MKKSIASITAVVVLGIMVMLIPVATYPQLLGGGENSLRTTFGEERDDYNSTSWRTLDEAAQALGKIDIGPTSFPTSLLQATLLLAASLIAAVAISLEFKTKMRLAVQELTTLANRW